MLRNGLIHLGESPTAKKVLMGTPITRSMAQRFVPGEDVASAIAASKEANQLGLKVTANYLGEAEKNRDTATQAGDTYIGMLEGIAAGSLDGNISVKFTQLGQAIDEDCLRENLGRVLELAKQSDTFIRFDMESSDYTQRTLDAFEVRSGDFSGPGTGSLVHQHHLCTQGAHHPCAFIGVTPGHHCDEWIAPHRANDSQPRTHVARCQFHHGLARHKAAIHLCPPDDFQGSPVLFGVARVQVFELGEDTTVEFCSDPVKCHHRRLTDDILN